MIGAQDSNMSLISQQMSSDWGGLSPLPICDDVIT